MKKIRLPRTKIERVLDIQDDGSFDTESYLLTIRCEDSIHVEQTETEEAALEAALSYLKGDVRPNAISTEKGLPAAIIPDECRQCGHLEDLIIGLTTGKKQT
jgi:hypothetical protein